MECDDISKSVSLLEPESRGGDIASSGFDFQDNYLITKIPFFLSFQGFTSLIHESIGDIEVKYFIPGEAHKIEFFEVKNHQVTPKEFWEEIERFYKVDIENPDLYLWFTLISTGISKDIHPLINGLRRIRNPYSFYPETSSIIENSFQDFKNIILSMKKDEKIADFLFRKVLVDPNWNLQEKGIGRFHQELVEYFPQYEILSYNIVTNIYSNLLRYIKINKNKPMNRMELENEIYEAIADKTLTFSKQITFNTLIENEYELKKEICFNWEKFFGGNERKYPPRDYWNRILLKELEETKNWIVLNSSLKEIYMLGSRRISPSIAIGFIFSAVSGFTLELDVRGKTFRTDSHPDISTTDYTLTSNFKNNKSERLVVTIGIMKIIEDEVINYLSTEGKSNASILNITSDQPIISDSQANLVVRNIKRIISDTLVKENFSTIDLFFAGPSFLALFLGHRLNATAKIQCYEWVGTNTYIPTCFLKG